MMLRRALASGLSAAVATAGVAALAVTAGPTGGLPSAPGDLALAAATGCASAPEPPTYTPTPTPTSSPTSSPTSTATASASPSPAKATASSSPTSTPTSTPTADPEPTTDPEPVTSVEMVQANIKSGTALKKFKADLRKVFRTCPDFVTFNEVPMRQPQYLAPTGYEMFRTPGQYTGANPVVWRTDRWTPEARGTTMISNKQGYGKGQHVMWGVRYANWVTLRSVDGKQTVSVVAVHIAPKSPRTTKLLGPSIQRLGALVGQLSGSGPVLVGGDFNRHYKSSEYPRALLDAARLNAVYDLSGKYEPTGDHRGATIDYVMVRPAEAFTVLKQRTRELNSDHDAVVVELSLPEETVGEPVVSFSAGTTVNDPASVSQRGRSTVIRSIKSVIKAVPAGEELRVRTSSLDVRRVAAKLLAAARRGVTVNVVTGTTESTTPERWLTKQLSEIPGSYVRHRPEAFEPGATSSLLLASRAGITPWTSLALDRGLSRTMVSQRTVLRLETKKKAYKKQVRAFQADAAPPSADPEEPVTEPGEGEGGDAPAPEETAAP